jgi:hypothetical protein
MLSDQTAIAATLGAGPNKDGTSCTSYYNRVVLKWNQQISDKTLYIDADKNNVATVGTMKTFHQAPQIAQVTQIVLNSERQEKLVEARQETSKDLDKYDKCEFDEFESSGNMGNKQVRVRGNTSSVGSPLEDEEELLEWQVIFGHI